MFSRSLLACAAFVLAGFILAGFPALAQTSEPRDAWLMRNYHFTGPVGGGETQPDDPRAQLDEIQRTVLSILRKTNFAGDYEAALAAAAQAAANVQFQAAMAARKQTSQSRPAPEPEPA